MMAGSETRSNQRPDTLMQDRRRQFDEIFLQRAAGPYIWVTSIRTRSENRTSISSHPLANLGWLLIGLRHRLLLISRSSFVRAKGRSFVPARRTSIASRAGAVKAGRRTWLAAGAGVARLRLDRAEHGAIDVLWAGTKERPLARTEELRDM